MPPREEPDDTVVPEMILRRLPWAVLALWLLAACSSSPSASGRPQVAELQANQMLEAVTVPDGSTVVKSLPGHVFAQAWQHPACTPLVDRTRTWTVPASPSTVVAYLQAHPPSWIPYGPTGEESSGGRISAYILNGIPDRPDWTSSGNPDQLQITVAALGSNTSGIRADAQAIPHGASCKTSGGPPSNQGAQ